MSSSEASRDFVERLASQMLDSGLSEEQRAELMATIESDADACDRFVDHVLLHATLRKELGAYRPATLSETLFGALQGEFPSADREAPRPASLLQTTTSWRHDARLSLAFLALGVAIAWLGLWLLDRSDPAGTPLAERPSVAPQLLEAEGPARQSVGEWVARLIRAAPDATWGKGSGPNDFLLRLRPGQTIELLSGLAEVEFVSGAVVILHGPSLFTPTGSDSATLKRGRVSGRADDGNFHLVTPTARVVDLGMEFGVVVDDASNTDVVVFEGEVSVAPHDSMKKRVDAIFLDGGATARIDASGELATGISIEWEAFERAIPHNPSTADGLLNGNSLSLIDIVNGGDGSGKILAAAIDPRSGGWDQRPWQHEHGPGRLGSDRQYHPAASHRLIDGVFIPSSEGKNTQITSLGIRADFPANLGATWGPIWARRRGEGALPSATVDFWGAERRTKWSHRLFAPFRMTFLRYLKNALARS